MGLRVNAAVRLNTIRNVWRDSFSRSHDAVIRVYDAAGNVIETHEHKGDPLRLLAASFNARFRSMMPTEIFDAATHHWATVTLKSTVFSPPLFLMTNKYFPFLFGVNFTEHFGPGESSFPTSLRGRPWS